MSTDDFINKIKHSPATISFDEVIQHITENYHYTPATFSNGLGEDRFVNEAGSNEGSCKIFAFGQITGLTVEQTLACFGDYYRIDVLKNPDATDHKNIRNFMKHGWQGIHFESDGLRTK